MRREGEEQKPSSCEHPIIRLRTCEHPRPFCSLVRSGRIVVVAVDDEVEMCHGSSQAKMIIKRHKQFVLSRFFLYCAQVLCNVPTPVCGVLVLRNCNGEACSGLEPVPGTLGTGDRGTVVDLISFRVIIRSGWISFTGSGLRWPPTPGFWVKAGNWVARSSHGKGGTD